MKIFPISLVINKMQTRRKYPFIPARLAMLKRQIMTRVGEDMEKASPSFTPGRTGK